MIDENLEIRGSDLYFAGRRTADLAARYGTPLYVMDEATVRRNCRRYREAMRAAFGESALPLYASKACCFKELYRIVGSEGLGADVVSSGEIYTAREAGFDMAKTYFHSNGKTDGDIRFALESGVGHFVADNAEELTALSQIAAEQGKEQAVLLRVTPGIDPHTYEAVNTGRVDSKFGAPIETGAAMALTKLALSLPGIALTGFHCHVGSQLFDSDVLIRSVDVMLRFIADVKAACGYEARELDLGGGYGVRYVESDPVLDLEENIRLVAQRFHAVCAELGIAEPAVRLEPGRSIVADAGLTLYRVQSVKRIEGYKNYVAVDGGMGDNPRYALYRSAYTVVAADRADEPCDFIADLAGRCCESGDLLKRDAALPAGIGRGDLIAVLTTGAYNYAMSSNYNRLPRPPIVLLREDGTEFVAVKGETFADLVRNDG